MTTKRRTSENDPEGTWTNERLPLQVRRDLMNKELRRVRESRDDSADARAALEESHASPPRHGQGGKA